MPEPWLRRLVGSDEFDVFLGISIAPDIGVRERYANSPVFRGEFF